MTQPCEQIPREIKRSDHSKQPSLKERCKGKIHGIATIADQESCRKARMRDCEYKSTTVQPTCLAHTATNKAPMGGARIAGHVILHVPVVSGSDDLAVSVVQAQRPSRFGLSVHSHKII